MALFSGAQRQDVGQWAKWEHRKFHMELRKYLFNLRVRNTGTAAQRISSGDIQNLPECFSVL